MRVRLGKDEWWPVLEIMTGPHGWGKERDVPDELIERYEAVYEEFQAVQAELWEIYDND